MTILNKMTSLMLVLSLVLSTTFAQRTSTAAGDVGEDRKIASFERLNVSSAFLVHLSQGSEESLRVEADPKVIDRIKTETKGGVLKIYLDGHVSLKGKPEIFLTFRELDGIKLAGASRIVTEDRLTFDDLDISSHGASGFKLNLEVNRLSLDIAGAAKAQLAGKADDIDFTLSGAGSINALELEAERAKVVLNGAAKARVNVSRTLNAKVSGAGAVRYIGNPQVNSKVSGVGSVKRVK